MTENWAQVISPGLKRVTAEATAVLLDRKILLLHIKQNSGANGQ